MRIASKKVKKVLSVWLMAVALVFLLPKNTVYGAEDPNVGTTGDNIENMIEVGKTLIGKTPYVYGGGHSDWDEQKQKDVPTGLDNSSFVAWVLYRGMGIDMGLAPISGDYENYFETVNVGTLEGVQRGDLIADDRQIEIYLGEDAKGKHYSLTATNERNNVTITETNWGRGVDSKTIIRPNMEDAKEGKNGLTFNEDAVMVMWEDGRAIGGNEPVKLATDGGGGGSSEGEELVEEDTDEEKKELGDKEDSSGTSKPSAKSDEESLFAWLNPIVDFSGASNTHSKSTPEGKQIDGNNKGLKGHKPGFLDMFF